MGMLRPREPSGLAGLKPGLADSQGVIGFASLAKLYFSSVPSLSYQVRS